MDFGLQVNDYAKASEGAYGYILKLDISVYLPRIMVFVQATNQPLGLDLTERDPVDSLADLQDLCDNEDCPNLAWYYSSKTLYVFFKEAYYSYADDDCRFSFAFKRNAINMVNETDKLDIPKGSYDLFRKIVKTLSTDDHPKKLNQDILDIKNRLKV